MEAEDRLPRAPLEQGSHRGAVVITLRQGDKVRTDQSGKGQDWAVVFTKVDKCAKKLSNPVTLSILYKMYEF